MHILRASRLRNAWRIHVSAANAGEKSAPGPNTAVQRGRRVVLDWRDRLIAAAESEAVCAEFPKAAIGEGEIALGYAELVADRCIAGNEDDFVVIAPRPWLSRRSVKMALHARGMRVAPSGGGAILDALSMLVAGFLAWCLLLLHALLHARHSGPVRASRWWLAVQGEWSNRTRHVLPEAIGENAPSTVLVLGRPTRHLSRVAEEWKSRLNAVSLPTLVRPWSLASVLLALPSSCWATVDAMRVAASAPYLPAFRERIGMAYRTHMGLASVQWWRRQRQRPQRVIYGHTGNADTTLLELAQQASGQETVHVVHGVSSGLNFTGRSSAAIFACAHDMRWHKRLGGYGQCRYLPAPVPAGVSGGSGLFLLTNYAHPMNVECRISGTNAEQEVLRAVSSAAGQLGEAELSWRPHPALTALDPVEQQELRRAANHLGFHELPQEQDWLRAARNARWVVTTASTVVIQLLQAGVVPVVLIPAWLDPECALARHPLAIQEIACLPEALSNLEQARFDRGELLTTAWQAIGPGSPSTVMDWLE